MAKQTRRVYNTNKNVCRFVDRCLYTYTVYIIRSAKGSRVQVISRSFTSILLSRDAKPEVRAAMLILYERKCPDDVAVRITLRAINHCNLLRAAAEGDHGKKKKNLSVSHLTHCTNLNKSKNISEIYVYTYIYAEVLLERERKDIRGSRASLFDFTTSYRRCAI